MPLVTVAEAARHLGLTEAAARQRIRRGTLASELVDGRRMVDLPAETVETVSDTVFDTVSDNVETPDTSLERLIQSLESENEYLRQTLDDVRDTHRAEIERRDQADHEFRVMFARRDDQIEELQRQLQLPADGTRDGHIGDQADTDEYESTTHPWWQFWSRR